MRVCLSDLFLCCFDASNMFQKPWDPRFQLVEPCIMTSNNCQKSTTLTLKTPTGAISHARNAHQLIYSAPGNWSASVEVPKRARGQSSPSFAPLTMGSMMPDLRLLWKVQAMHHMDRPYWKMAIFPPHRLPTSPGLPLSPSPGSCPPPNLGPMEDLLLHGTTAMTSS
jgi:hypothetical protein